jgi:iron complex outermembrane receptor protein
MKTNVKRVRARTRGAVACRASVVALLGLPAIVSPAAAWQAQSQITAFDIESQALSAALLAFGRQAGVSIVASTSLVEGRTAPALSGRFTPTEALERLLAGSGLSFEFVMTDAVRIIPADRAELPRTTQTAQSDGGRERIVVTGTHIRGVLPDASPIEIYTRDDIERSGATTTEQFISRLPQNLGTLSQHAAGSMTGQPNLDSVSAIDLRGLGIGTTLTLLNGRRIGLSSSGRSADVSLIPASALERVEVLTDGASAVYGSDAVGGVVNFVLRDDFEGSETRASYGGVASGGLRQGGASQAVGGSWRGGHGMLAYDYHSASALRTGDRAYSAAAGPGNLTPTDSRHSAFTALTQDITDRLTLDVNAGAGWRKVKNGYSNLLSSSPAAHTQARYASTTEHVFGSGALTYELTDGLTADLSASYGLVDTNGGAEIVRINQRPPITTTGDYSARSSQLDVMGRIEASLLDLPAGKLRASFGGGLLEETYEGVSPVTSRQSAGRLGRRSPYAFGELYIPVASPEQGLPFLRRMSVSLAVRYTDYQDDSTPGLPGDFGDSTDPRVGLFWSPAASIGVRATYGTSFRAPSLTQLDPTGGQHYLSPQVIAGRPSILLGMTSYPAEGLGPETATTLTAGLDVTPTAIPGFRLSATWYSIDYEDRIAAAPSGGINPFSTPELLPDLIYQPPSEAFLAELLTATSLLSNRSGVDVSDPQVGARSLFLRDDVWIMDTRLRNLSLSRQQGMDLSASYAIPYEWGSVSLGAHATHILGYEQQSSAASSRVGVVDIPGYPLDWRVRAFAGLSRGAFNASLNLNYADDYMNPRAAAGQRAIDAWTTLDLNLAYAVRSGDGKGPRLSLSVQNLLDEEPPRLATGDGSNISFPVGFDPANANPLGRFIVLGVTQTW